MRIDLPDDPAVIAMSDRLELDVYGVVGRLHKFWSWIDRQSHDGHVTGVTHKWLDRFVTCDGFAAALVAVKWLEHGEDGLTVPNFDRHNGETAKTRALSANRQRKHRASSVTPESRDDRDDVVTREEKRREEKGEKTNARATSITLPFIPGDSVKRWAAEKFSMLNFDEEVSAFVDHHKAKGSLFKDWDAALRTWIRNSAKWNPRSGPPKRTTHATPPRRVIQPSEITQKLMERKR